MTDYRKALYAAYRSTQYGFVNQGTLSPQVQESYANDLGPLLPSQKDARIIDVGCGSGYLLEFIKQRGYTNFAGVDASAEQVAFAQQRGLPVTSGDAIPFLRENGVFDRIFMIDILEHFRKDEIIPLLETAHNALKPGGCLVIRTINASSVFGLTARYMDFTHEVSFSESSLRQLLLATGYSIRSIHDTRPPLGWRPKRLLRWVIWRLWRGILNLIFLAEVGMDRPRLLGKYIIIAAEPKRGE